MVGTGGESDAGERESEYQRVINAWAMYDWANSAFAVVMVTAIFPVYYRELVLNAGGAPADATAYWAYTNSFSLLLIALIGPLLGATADAIGGKKLFLSIALFIGVLGSAALAWVRNDNFILASLIFSVANLGFAGGNIFYEALLPHIARADDLDRVSARGYAFGYLGGGILLIIDVLSLLRPDWFGMPDRNFALRACFVSVALWWAVFALPLLRARTARESIQRIGVGAIVSGFVRLRATFGQVRRYQQMALFLVAFWIYNDGISTIIKLAAAYGDEIGIRHDDMLVALVVTQLVGFPSSFAFGTIATRLGAKRAILAGLAAYALISIAGFLIRSAWHFFVLAIVVGLVQGGTQALSRSLFASMVPKTRSSEFFGFFSTGEKVAGIIGPAIFGIIGQLTGSSRWGIVSVVVLFVAGALILMRVDVSEAQRVAEAADAST
ncbi:MAG TPA: MFS transporter [Candidatus Binatia bacterium]|nr:MFS transporter [Candidatus Binatia bacterium]